MMVVCCDEKIMRSFSHPELTGFHVAEALSLATSRWNQYKDM
jgi:hypothetical protein